MKAQDELTALYQLWRKLTESEGQAMRAGAWPEVDQCQAAKLALQPRITEVSSGLDPDLHEQRFLPVVEELMQLERRNRELLQAQRQIAQMQKDELDHAGRNLRQLHQSYIPADAPHRRAHWQSWS